MKSFHSNQIMNDTGCYQPRQINDDLSCRRKFVRFVDCDENRNIVTVLEYPVDSTNEDICNAWYSENELNAIEREACRLLCQKIRGSNKNDDTIRGLERRTAMGEVRWRKRTLNALSAVLREQQRQICKGEYDAIKLAEAYRTVSIPCQTDAHETAKVDEMVVREEVGI